MAGSDLKQIGNTPWVRSFFALTDCTSLNWGSSSYGTVTLLDHCLSVKQVSRLRYVSEYFRDGLLVDLAIHYVYENAVPRSQLFRSASSGSVIPILIPLPPTCHCAPCR